MPRSENKMTRAKGWFLSYCETMNKLAYFRSDYMSPQAWKELRTCRYSKLCNKIYNNKNYKCSQDEVNMILNFYDELVDCYKERKDKNISKEDFFRQYCTDRLTKLMEQYPAIKVVASEELIIERKEEEEVMEERKPTISIADKLSALEKLDFEYPSSIDFIQLYEDGLIFFGEDYRPRILSDDLYFNDNLIIPDEEKKKAFDVEIKLFKAFFEHNLIKGYVKPLLKMFNERDNLLSQFKNETDISKKELIMFEVKELDRKIRQFKKNKMEGV